ncbi:peptidase S41 [Chitinophaga agrisoli]|uniref:Peptidase S41 n=1 Tax=Chitinophaga agrisoli TaxID=2607653 RepID=A0A5B2VT50_9BACT|nr:S41 family peptidase [Chitinophaga agrisoli]KAA2241309.1 peptidase S41 [Chitinophaga agrisoli]
MERRNLLTRFIIIFLLSFTGNKSHAQIANTLSPADKVFGLSKFWQEVNYNFVYLDKLGRPAWDSAYKALIPQVEATKNDYEYYRLLQKFCALLKDGHTEITMPPIEGVNYMYNTFGDHLLVLKRVDNKVIIKRTWKKDLNKYPLGSQIIAVNGLPTEQYIRDSIAPYISSSTDYVRDDIAAGMLLRGFPGSTFTIKIKKPNGEQATYSLTHARVKDSIFTPEAGAYLDEQKRELLEHRSFDNGIAYIALNSFGNPKIDTLFENLLPELERAKGIIIDLRYNGGGDDGVAFRILQHFIKDTILVGSSFTVRTFNPYRQAAGKFVEVADTAGHPDKREAWRLFHGYAVYDEPGVVQSEIGKDIKRIAAPVVILTGIYTESAAEDFVIAADNQKHIVKIGELTNGSTGMPYSFDMPGGGAARICIKKDAYPDGREFVGYGIQPDITVVPKVNDYLQNKDVVLEAALKYFREKK